MKHSLRSMYAADGVSIVGNVVYFNNELPSREEVGRLAKWLPKQEWYLKAVACMGIDMLNSLRISGFVALESLAVASSRSGFEDAVYDYDDPFSDLRKRGEPEWMSKLPRKTSRYLRCRRVFGEIFEPFAMVPFFPYAGFGYAVPEDGMVREASETFFLGRLANIKQLSFIQSSSAGIGTSSLAFGHTRYCHILDTHAVANLISNNLGLDEARSNTLLTAAVSHDSLTPAGGDAVKMIDPAVFDEDAHYCELLVREKWEAYRARYGIDEALLLETIGGKGLLGHILDISDKSSYLSRDIHAYLGGDITAEVYAGKNEVADIVIADPSVCALWDSAHYFNGSLVIGDAERFARFLKLRALMFRDLYSNPRRRFLDTLVGKGVAKYLYRKKLITRAELLSFGDCWIENKIDEVLEAPYALRKLNSLENARMEEFPETGSARKRAAEFKGDLSTLCILDDFIPSTSTGTRKFFVRKGKRAVPFFDACPKKAEEIENIMKFSPRVRLYFFNPDDLGIPKGSRKKIKDILDSV